VPRLTRFVTKRPRKAQIKANLTNHRDDRALHPQEDEEEQVSLAERFGLRLAFHPLDQEQYLGTVAHWLGRPLDLVTRQKALQYALAHGSRSARVAAQCARSLR